MPYITHHITQPVTEHTCKFNISPAYFDKAVPSSSRTCQTQIINYVFFLSLYRAS